MLRTRKRVVVAALLLALPGTLISAAPASAAVYTGLDYSVVGIHNAGTGCLDVFAVAVNEDSVGWNTQCTAGTGWSGWKSLGGETYYTARTVAAVADTGGRLHVAVHGTDHAIWVKDQTAPGTGGAWTAWRSLGQPAGGLCGTCIPAITINGSGLPQVFVNGDRIYTASLQPNGNWTGYSSTGSGDIGTTDPVATRGWLGMWTAGEFSSAIRFREQGASGSWGSWTSLGGGYDFPAATKNSLGRMEVFASRMSDERIHHRTQTAAGGSSWTGWTDTGGTVNTFAPHIELAVDSCNRTTAAVVGTGYALHYIREGTAGMGNFGSWVGLGGTAYTGTYISLSNNAANNLILLVRGTDLRVWYRYQTSCGVWNGSWQSIPGTP